jgi:hypothetical protein
MLLKLQEEELTLNQDASRKMMSATQYDHYDKTKMMSFD